MPPSDRIFFTLRYSPGKNWKQGKTITQQDLTAHRNYHQKLSENGRVLLGGAYMESDEGLIMLKVESIEEAMEIAENDPAVIENIMEVDIQTLFLVFKDRDPKYLDGIGLITQ